MTKTIRGEVDCHFHQRAAAIRLIDPIDYPKDCISPYNMEKTLIHELLHCSFGAFRENTSAENEMLHQIIDDMAKAIWLAQEDRT